MAQPASATAIAGPAPTGASSESSSSYSAYELEAARSAAGPAPAATTTPAPSALTPASRATLISACVLSAVGSILTGVGAHVSWYEYKFTGFGVTQVYRYYAYRLALCVSSGDGAETCVTAVYDGAGNYAVGWAGMVLLSAACALLAAATVVAAVLVCKAQAVAGAGTSAGTSCALGSRVNAGTLLGLSAVATVLSFIGLVLGSSFVHNTLLTGLGSFTGSWSAGVVTAAIGFFASVAVNALAGGARASLSHLKGVAMPEPGAGCCGGR